MKVGDQIPVTIDGIPVALAIVEKIESDRATLSFEGHRVVMAIRVQLVDENPQPERDTETIITGVDRADSEAPDAPPSEPAAQTVDEAPVLSSESTESAVGETSAE